MHSNSGWIGVLTPKEAEAVELLALGQTNTQIAGELGVSVYAVCCRLRCVFRKLGVQARVGGRGGVAACCPRVVAARWWWEHVES